MALLPVVGVLSLGVGVALAGFGSIEVLEAPIVPRTPVLTLPPSAPQPSPPSPVGSPDPPPAASPPTAGSLGSVGSTPPTAVLTAPLEEVATSSPSSSVSTSTTTTTAQTAPEPSIPRTAEDCRAGGWREVVDDGGHPFANQGACIQFVERRGQHP